MAEFEMILLAFTGGVFGASIGALWAFCLCGLLTMGVAYVS